MAHFERTPRRPILRGSGSSVRIDGTAVKRGPQGYPGMDSAEVQAIADDATAAQISAASSATSAAASASDADDAATRAENAEAAKLEVPDLNVSALIGNATTDTHAALRESFTYIDEPGFDVILLAGQSNMSGRGVPFDTATTDPADTRVYQFGSDGRIIALATEPLDMHDTPTGIGPGLGFARWYASRIATGRRVLLVPTAHGGTGFRAGTLRWTTTHTPAEDNLYLQAIRQTREALAAAGPGSRLTAILWHQGEFDAVTQAGADAYQANLDALITGFRTELGTVPFILGQMVPDHLTTAYRAQVDAIHADTPNRVTGTAYAAGITGSYIDGTHYAALGQRFLARSMFEAYTALRDGATVTAPATPTGLTVTDVTDTSITLEWDGVPEAIGYTIRWWPSGQPATQTAVMGTTLTLTGLASGTKYIATVDATNSAGTSPASAGVTPTTSSPAPSAPLLDDTPGALTALSTRLLSSTYAGPALRVRRASDSTEQDIGFTSDVLDTAALTAFVGAGDGHVVTWYDQSGNTRDLTQATPAAQPRIVIGGTVQTRDGNPVAVFDGTDDHLTGADFMYDAGAATAALITHIDPSASATRVYSEGNSATATAQYSAMFVQPSTSTPAALIRDNANASVLAFNGESAGTMTGDVKQLVTIDTGTSLENFVDGTGTGPGAYTRTTTTLDNFTLGALKRSTLSSFTPMACGEVVVWTGALDATEQTTVRTNQQAHWGTA